MKLSTVEERSIERMGTGSERTFAVKGTAKAFRILSSGLYKDKILAIVRELSCNAYDAHVAAGCVDEPFHVHLPNSLEPYFSIRDNGIGLSHDQVMTLYSTYFESTKTESNDFIGALGLGSKSPFSYVDSFTVISRYQGEMRTYALFIDEEGCPVVTMMGDPMPTEERNGLEVNIPVDKPSDYAEFASRAARVFKYFDPLPVVTGWHNFTVDRPQVKLTGDGYRLVDRYGGAIAIMGKIAYPIDIYSVASDWTKYQNANVLQAIMELPLEIEFANGSLDFTAGREELSYDPKVTIPALINRAVEIMEDLPKRIDGMFEDCKTEAEARELYGELFQYNSPLARAAQIKKVNWRGKEIDAGYFTIEGTEFDGLTVSHFYEGYRSVRTENWNFGPKHGRALVNASKNVRVFKDDLTRGGLSRIKHLIRQTGAKAYLLQGSDEAIGEAIKLLDGYELELTSALDKPPSKTRSKARVRVLSDAARAHGWVSRSYLEDVDVEIEDGGYYLKTKNGVIQGLGHNNHFTQKWQTAKECGLFDFNKHDLHVVPVSLSKDFDESDDWVDWLAAMKEAARDKLEREATSEAFAKVRSLRKLRERPDGSREVLDRLRAVARHIKDQSHPIWVFLTTYDEYAKPSQEVEKLERLSAAWGIEVKTPKIEHNLVNMVAELMKQYPVLPIFIRPAYYRHYDSTDYTIMADYVALKDEAVKAGIK